MGKGWARKGSCGKGGGGGGGKVWKRRRRGWRCRSSEFDIRKEKRIETTDEDEVSQANNSEKGNVKGRQEAMKGENKG